MPNGFNIKAPWTDVELMDMTVQSLDASEDNLPSPRTLTTWMSSSTTTSAGLSSREATDDVFNDIKNVDGDNMKAIADKFIQPAHRAVVQDVMATYNPLDDKKPSNAEVSEDIKAGLIERIGDRFIISAVDVTFIDTTQATKDRINMLNAERANTRIAEQKKETATNSKRQLTRFLLSLFRTIRTFWFVSACLIDESKPSRLDSSAGPIAAEAL